MKKKLSTVIKANVLDANIVNLNLIGYADSKRYVPVGDYFTLDASLLNGSDVLR